MAWEWPQRGQGGSGAGDPATAALPFCTRKRLRKNLNLDDHFDRSFLLTWVNG